MEEKISSQEGNPDVFLTESIIINPRYPLVKDLLIKAIREKSGRNVRNVVLLYRGSQH